VQEKEYAMVEVPPPPAAASWRKSSASADGDPSCVQATGHNGLVWVRDSKNPGGLILGLSREQWTAFLGGVQRDELSDSGAPV
jgi:hypothetical protein